MKIKTPFYRFALLRHAQTHWNAAKRIQGHLNSDLTDQGEKQVHLYVKKIKSLGFTAILSSDLGRALQTAKIINTYLNLPLVKDARLREQDWGRWAGKTLAAIKKEEKELLTRQIAAGWEFLPPEGETRRMVFERSCKALTRWAVTSEHVRTLVISHEGTIKCILYGLLNRKFLPSESPLMIPNHLHWVAYNGQNLLVEKVNERNMNVDGDKK
ncbi:MAG: histidine phosphatase family protein [Desulfobacteraceae bacterium]|jgi:probable phosphoglycerate mutase